MTDEPQAPKPVRTMVYELPLREDFTVQLVLPRDLNATEARRLGMCLLTLAVDITVEELDRTLWKNA